MILLLLNRRVVVEKVSADPLTTNIPFREVVMDVTDLVGVVEKGEMVYVLEVDENSSVFVSLGCSVSEIN